MNYDDAAMHLRINSRYAKTPELSLAMNLCAQAVDDLRTLQAGECPLCREKIQIHQCPKDEPAPGVVP